MADTVFTAVKAYLGARLETELRKVKTALDERMGEVQAEMLAFVGSFERRMTTLENLPEPKAADAELIARVNRQGTQLSSFEKPLAAIGRRKD